LGLRSPKSHRGCFIVFAFRVERKVEEIFMRQTKFWEMRIGRRDYCDKPTRGTTKINVV
jgi:hypothetical protein